MYHPLGMETKHLITRDRMFDLFRHRVLSTGTTMWAITPSSGFSPFRNTDDSSRENRRAGMISQVIRQRTSSGELTKRALATMYRITSRRRRTRQICSSNSTLRRRSLLLETGSAVVYRRLKIFPRRHLLEVDPRHVGSLWNSIPPVAKAAGSPTRVLKLTILLSPLLP